jgi:hypothetical protein
LNWLAFENFVKVCENAFENGSNNVNNINNINNESKKIKYSLIMNDKNAIIDIIYSDFLNTDLRLELDIINLDENIKKDIIIKQLQSKIHSLEKCINEIAEIMIIEHKFLENFDYTFIYDSVKYLTKSSFTGSFYVPIGCKTIILKRFDSKIAECYNNKLCKHIPFHSSNIEKFNKNFKLIKCNELVIVDVDYDCGLENMPKTIKKICFFNLNKNMFRFILSLIKKLNLEYLDTIEIHNLLDLTYVNDLLDFHTMIKILNIYNCPNLKNISLIKKHGTVVNKN